MLQAEFGAASRWRAATPHQEQANRTGECRSRDSSTNEGSHPIPMPGECRRSDRPGSRGRRTSGEDPAGPAASGCWLAPPRGPTASWAGDRVDVPDPSSCMPRALILDAMKSAKNRLAKSLGVLMAEPSSPHASFDARSDRDQDAGRPGAVAGSRATSAGVDRTAQGCAAGRHAFADIATGSHRPRPCRRRPRTVSGILARRAFDGRGALPGMRAGEVGQLTGRIGSLPLPHDDHYAPGIARDRRDGSGNRWQALPSRAGQTGADRFGAGDCRAGIDRGRHVVRE
jgi:hypothetical protein